MIPRQGARVSLLTKKVIEDSKELLFVLYLFIFTILKIFFFNLYIYLFIFGCVGSSLLCRGLSLVAVSRGYSLLRCAGFSLQWPLLLRSTGSSHTGFSSCGSRALECGLGSCGTQAQLLCGMWDLPRPGLEPVFPALAGRFLITVPPGKPHI